MPDLAWRALGAVCDPSAATPWLALHGFTGWGGDFASLGIGGFDEAVLAPDLPGHAQCDVELSVEMYRLESTAALLIAELDRRAIAQVNLLGYSMGGRLGLTLACLYPDRVCRAVYVGASAGIADVAARAARRADDLARAAHVRGIGAPRFLQEWAAHPLIASQQQAPEAVRAVMQAGRRQHTAVGLARSLEHAGTGSMAPLYDRMNALTMPTLFVAGAHDVQYRAVAEELACRVRGAKHAAVEGCGHAPHLENPTAFVCILKAFAGQNAPHRPRTEP